MATAMVSVAGRRRRSWDTLRLLRAGRLCVFFLAALLLIAVVSATEAHRAALKTVGRDTAPSIIAAQRIKSAMAEMDADAANELLVAPGSISNASLDFQDQRDEAAKALISAAENITYGDAERAPILTLQVGLGTYERLVQRALDLHDSGNPKMMEAYRSATALMDSTLSPTADALDKANDDILERTYKAQSFRSAGSRFSIVSAGVLLVVMLFAMQTMLSQRMHRTFNPLLMAATLVAIGLTAHSLSAVSNSRHDLQVAKEGAFTSLHALWRARATAYEAHSEESRYLVDPLHAAEHEAAFRREADTLWSYSGGLTDAELLDALRARTQLAGMGGYLGDELHHTTIRGEREAALGTLASWQQYVAVDQQMRTLEHTGQRKAAVELCTGTAPGESDTVFAQFDGALGQTLAIDKGSFDRAVNDGFQDLRELEAEAGVGFLVIIVLAFLGLAPRIREYQ